MSNQMPAGMVGRKACLPGEPRLRQADLSPCCKIQGSTCDQLRRPRPCLLLHCQQRSRQLMQSDFQQPYFELRVNQSFVGQ